ncbi:MAG: hypothetical protein LBC18_03490, partial [Opitutaceae bacterium]|nr:hypothetical protein [Opitutaceae bacterium]
MPLRTLPDGPSPPSGRVHSAPPPAGIFPLSSFSFLFLPRPHLTKRKKRKALKIKRKLMLRSRPILVGRFSPRPPYQKTYHASHQLLESHLARAGGRLVSRRVVGFAGEEFPFRGE